MATNHIQELDVHDIKKKYETAVRKLLDSPKVIDSNKRLIMNFLRDCEIGKTVIKRSKKRIKPNRLLKYLYILKQLDGYFKKDFHDVTQEEMEMFISKVDSNTLESVSDDGTIIRHNYTEWTRHDIKIALKKFYKWLLGENNEYPKIVAWIDTYIKEADPPALSKDEISKMVESASGIRSKALMWCLFETGARVSELLNVRLCHVTNKENYFAVRIIFSKTFKRTVPVFEGHQYLKEWIKIHPDKDNPEAQLFPITYGALRMWIKRLGKRAINKDVHPHLIRHSYATWLAGKKIGRYEMCKLMGWAMSSNMPDRYIDRLGVIEEDTIQSIRGDELKKEQVINNELKTELSVLQMKYNQIIEQLDKKKGVDDFMQKVISDKEVQKVLSEKIKEMGLESELSRL